MTFVRCTEIGCIQCQWIAEYNNKKLTDLPIARLWRQMKA